MNAQFVHLEEYGLERGRQGQPNVFGVLREARREIEYCKHVENVRAPIKLDGIDLKEVEEEIKKARDDIKEKGRAIRKDSKVIVAGVVSYPIKVKDVNDIGELNNWCRKTIGFLNKEFGENMKSAILHMDEENPHIHFYVYNKNTLRINDIHPAYIEKDKEKIKKKKRGAFKKGLMKFADRYFHEVSSDIGHTRFKNKRKRMDRDNYLELKNEASKRIHQKGEFERKLKFKELELGNVKKENNEIKLKMAFLIKIIKSFKLRAKKNIGIKVPH
ncbi:plasmid recombination protein [Paraglaciecola sp. L3A3]|uniref:plasmid recombination protein n=1 Tax=Paraglaciecola sp. L3A3 TaxID=2686358 RepID=UPI00131A8458|nr:plasmid recombination protein [Paraglaciecola sp. L3A3]